MRAAVLFCIICILLLPQPAASAKIATQVMPQYAVIQTNVTVAKITTTTTTTTTSSVGSVTIQSYPSGAEIWIGGSDTGQVMPYTILVRAGATAPAPYQIVLKLSGYQDFSATVTPRLGQTQTVSAKMIALTTAPTTTATTTPTTIMTSVTATSSPTILPTTDTTRKIPSLAAATATHPPSTVPANVSTSGTAVAAGTVPPTPPGHTPRRVPGFEAAAAGTALAGVLFLKRNG